MRAAIAATVFAAGALAVPAHRHLHKRDLVVDYDYVTVTEIVTVTGPAPEATTSSVVSAVNNSPATSSRTRHHWWTWTSQAQSSTAAPASTEAPSSAAPSSEAPAPSSEAPAPSSYQAPSPSSEAPATTAAPSTWATSSSEAPATTAAPTSSADSALPSTYSAIAVKHHNIHRSNHSAPDIEWDAGLAATAQKIADSCVYAHDVTTDGGGYGQNIAAGVDAVNISAIITDLFYNGEVGWYDNLYGQANPDMTNFEHWGHFSQIVWKGTEKVGCATKVCSSLQNVGNDVSPVFTVCNYSPPGNYAGEYDKNVLSPGDNPDATAQWNTDLPAGYGDS